MTEALVTKDESLVTGDISIPDDISRLFELGHLETLLKDRSTGENIIWADNEYVPLGDGYQPTDEISVDKITGKHAGTIIPRVAKERETQSKLTRDHAEVFTPTWICKKMIDWADEAWHEDFSVDGEKPEWLSYIESPRLEITCGEAPFLVNRYDASTGEYVPPQDRAGILGRKLKLASEHAKDRSEWIDLAKKAFQSIYGYEYQGDNLLLARINILLSLDDFAIESGYDPLTNEELEEFANIVSWNIWQMDGLTNCVPYGKEKPEQIQESLFGDLFADEVEKETTDPNRGLAKIKNWTTGQEIAFAQLKQKGKEMKFDYIIGNPPYQEETEGTSDKPVYDRFMDGAFSVSNHVELITPARFLFNAGKTPERWNKERLADPHFKVLQYWQTSQDVFPNNDIKGGIAVTYRDINQDFGAIGTFTSFSELNSILKKVQPHTQSESLDDWIVPQNKWNLDELYKDYPECRNQIGSSGRERRLTTSIFTTVNVFHDTKQDGDATILGQVQNSV